MTHDTEAFIELLKSPETCDLFSAGELIVTRAPGRIDVMGGIADYSGALVLQFPIAAATHVALQLHDELIVRIHSLSETSRRTYEVSLQELMTAGEPISYATARAMFARDSQDHWAAYVAGAFVALMREKSTMFDRGASILISSAVPEGKGVSSSAALEVASMQAIAVAYNIRLSPIDLAVLCQKVENLIAGAPCGVMDQMTSACGESDRLLSLLCQPAQLNGTVRLPDELRIWGLDSGIRHSVGGSDYGTVRTSAFMGYRIIVDVVGEDKWNGYLANVTPAEFEQHFAHCLPREITGHEFLKRYRGITDSVTKVKPDHVYNVRHATRHPVYEHARVQSFAKILQDWKGLQQAEALSEMMYQSHDSYSACGLGSSGTDELVRLVQEIGISGGLYGARITGGGSGGTVAVLGHRDEAPASIARIVEMYARKTGYTPIVVAGSSPGAGVFGHLRLRASP